MKGIYPLVILVVIALAFFVRMFVDVTHSRTQPNQPAAVTQGTGASASWAYPFVRWDSRTYKTSTDAVEKVGQVLGQVTTSSEEEAAASDGNFSNRFPVGTKYYEIPGVDPMQAIAVEDSKGHYIKAMVTNQ